MRRRSAATFDGRLAEEAWEPRRAGATQPRPSATSLGCTPQLHGATVQGGPTAVPSAERVRRALPLPAVRAAKGREAVAGGGEWLAEWPPVPTLATRPGYPSVHESVCGGLWERDETDS